MAVRGGESSSPAAATAAKFRIVRCPNCGRLLPELVGFQFYRCGGCNTTLEAKRRISATATSMDISDGENMRVSEDLENPSSRKGTPPNASPEGLNASVRTSSLPTPKSPSPEVEQENHGGDFGGNDSPSLGSPASKTDHENRRHEFGGNKWVPSAKAEDSNGGSGSKTDQENITDEFAGNDRESLGKAGDSAGSLASKTDLESRRDEFGGNDRISLAKAEDPSGSSGSKTDQDNSKHELAGNDRESVGKTGGSNETLAAKTDSNEYKEVPKDHETVKNGGPSVGSRIQDRDSRYRHPSKAPMDDFSINADELGKRGTEKSRVSKMQEENAYDVQKVKQTSVSRVEDWGNASESRTTPRTSSQGIRFSPYSGKGTSNFQPRSSYSRREYLNSDLPDRIEHLEQDPAELLRKLDALRDQLIQSCEVTKRTNDRVSKNRRTVSLSPYEPNGRDDWFHPGSPSFNRPPFQHFPLVDEHDIDMQNHHSAFPVPEIPGYREPFGSRSHRRTYQASHLYQQRPSMPSVYEQFDSNPVTPYSPDTFYHQPTCPCQRCRSKHWQLPPQAPPTVFSSRNPYLAHGCGFYPADNSAVLDPGSCNPRRTNSSSLFRHQLSHKRPVSVKQNERECGPLAGGTPFIVCYSCHRLLQVPDKLLRKDRHRCKLQCGSCSQVITFEITGKQLLISAAESRHPGTGGSLEPSNDTVGAVQGSPQPQIPSSQHAGDSGRNPRTGGSSEPSNDTVCAVKGSPQHSGDFGRTPRTNESSPSNYIVGMVKGSPECEFPINHHSGDSPGTGGSPEPSNHTIGALKGSPQCQDPTKQHTGYFGSSDCNVQSTDEKLVQSSSPSNTTINNEMAEKEHSSKLDKTEDPEGSPSSSRASKEVEIPEVMTHPKNVTSSTELPKNSEVKTHVQSLLQKEKFGYTSSNQVVSKSGTVSRGNRSEQERVVPSTGNFQNSSVDDISVEAEMNIAVGEYCNYFIREDFSPVSKEVSRPRVHKGGTGDSFFTSFIKKSFRELSRSNHPSESEKFKVSVNGCLIPHRLVKKAEKQAGPIQPGEYWYDYRAGFWGVMGQPCLGIIPPFIEEFRYPMPKNCGAGNTDVLVNGRELHQKDLDLLVRQGLPKSSGRSYIVEMSGRVSDAVSGEELDGLGKLAPTIEKLKRGFGMRIPTIAAV